MDDVLYGVRGGVDEGAGGGLLALLLLDAGNDLASETMEGFL